MDNHKKIKYFLNLQAIISYFHSDTEGRGVCEGDAIDALNRNIRTIRRNFAFHKYMTPVLHERKQQLK